MAVHRLQSPPVMAVTGLSGPMTGGRDAVRENAARVFCGPTIDWVAGLQSTKLAAVTSGCR